MTVCVCITMNANATPKHIANISFSVYWATRPEQLSACVRLQLNAKEGRPAVGPGKLSAEGVRIEPDVKVGQKVLYGKYSGTEVTVEGEEYLILRESDILAVLG